MKHKAPRGTKDVLPADMPAWHYLENVFEALCRAYGYAEIRTPIFEDVDVFIRSVGEKSDVVQKEMYTFTDRGGRRLALRPECTAGVSRAFIEHGFHNLPQPVKLYYRGPMFRYDRPQAGRQRQFYQMGIELFGSTDPGADVEVIKFTSAFFDRLGFKGLQLHLNSVGCRECRPPYQERLKKVVELRKAALCSDCQKRLQDNPLRLLDCKVPGCQAALQEVPRIDENLCASCAAHFEAVKTRLDLLQIDYFLDSHLVRGLDYYTHTAFEFVSRSLGSQDSLGGGGRYDDLIEAFEGPPTPGVGMAVGVERILLAMEKEGLSLPPAALEGVYIAAAPASMQNEGLLLLYRLREAGLRAEADYMGRSLKAMMKHAHRGKYRFVVILDEETGERGAWKIRDMSRGEQREYAYEELLTFLLSERAEGEA